jgi:predicted GNAT family N-acyltransferase
VTHLLNQLTLNSMDKAFKTCVSVIEFGSAQYLQAAWLRYRLFYQEHNIPFESINNDAEIQDIHVAVLNRIDDRVLAYGRLAQNNSLEFQIHQMVVQPEYQAKGFGSQILHSLVNLAREKGASTIVLNARVTRVDFYKKFGFRTMGDIFASASTGVPHIKMQRFIDASE